MPLWIADLIKSIFGVSMFINAALFIPQALRLLKEKTSSNVSLVTFAGFCLIQIATIAYGYLRADYLLMIGFGLSFITCGFVTILIIYYRLMPKTPTL